MGDEPFPTTDAEAKLMPDNPPLNKNAISGQDLREVKPPKPPPPPRDILLGHKLILCLMFPAWVFILVSIGIPWYRKRQYSSTDKGVERVEDLFYLFKSVFKLNNKVVAKRYPNQYCYPVRVRVRVLETFVISSALLCLLTLVFSFVSVLKKGYARFRKVIKVLAVCTFITLTVSVAFNFSIYFWSFGECGKASSYRLSLFEPYGGYGLIVTAWVLSMLSSYIAANKIVIPFDSRSLRLCCVFHLMSTLTAFVMSIIACFTPHWFYKNGETRLVTDVLLWHQREGKFNWNYTAPSNCSVVNVSQFRCSALVRYFRVIEAFSIASVSFNFFAFVSAILLWLRLSGIILPAVVLSCSGSIITLVQMGLELKVYYSNWCNDKYYYSNHFYVLSSGFELVVSAFCFMCAASGIATTVYVIDQIFFTLKGPWKSAKDIFFELIK